MHVYQRRRVRTSFPQYVYGGERFKLQERFASPEDEPEDNWVTIAEGVEPQEALDWVLRSHLICQEKRGEK